MKVSFRTIERSAKLVRDIGLIVGIPTLIVVGSKLYDQQIAALKAHSEALEAQNKFLRETQYDRAAALLESQKKVYELERDTLAKKIAALEEQDSANPQESDALRAQLNTLNDVIKYLNAARAGKKNSETGPGEPK